MARRLPLKSGRNSVQSGVFAFIDDDDVGRVLERGVWRVLVSGTHMYAANGDGTLLHRFLLDAPKGLVVDHKNGDGLDNRRANLRLATHSQNLANQSSRETWKQRRTTSKYKGVSLLAGRGKPWRATISVNTKQQALGYYATEEEAAAAYDNAAMAAFGEFAQTNFPALSNNEHESDGNDADLGTLPIAQVDLRRRPDGSVEIPLTHGRGHRPTDFVAVVDQQDVDFVMGHRWVTRRGANGLLYACRQEGRSGTANHRQIYMHRAILSAVPGTIVDHANGDGLDNRRGNLRITDQSHNSFNARPRQGSSRYKGVSWSTEHRKWSARIGVNYQRKHLGFFDDEGEAARAYNRAAATYFGDFARPNVV